MPNWILGTKRRRSKDDREPVDLKKQKGKALYKCAGTGACSSSDSGYSMSPVGSSSSELDSGELDCKPRSSACLVHVSSTSGEEPLNLSLKDLKNLKDINGLKDLKDVKDRQRDEGPSSASGDLVESPDEVRRRMEIDAHRIQMHLLDANLRYNHHYQQQQQLQQQLQHQQQILAHQPPLKATSGELKSKGKTAKKRHLSADEDDESHVTEALVTPEAVAKLKRIENKIGGYDCKLCTNVYTNAFDLANHNCSGIVKVEHRCPECGKVFQCPANLASHRRWHGLRASNREVSWAPVTLPPESLEVVTT